MTSTKFPLDLYRSRIGVTSSGGHSVERLEEIQASQLCAIAYENFDVLLGRKIDLTSERLVAKLLNSPRGGYCFELNGLLFRALEAEGFSTRRLLARVHLAGDPSGRGHQLCLVSIDGRDWVVDAGNGAICPRTPMLLETGRETNSGGKAFRLIDHELGYMLQTQQKGEWSNVYSFDLMPVIDADIAYGNHFTSTHPSSFFLNNRVTVLCHSDGQTILFNDNCTVVHGEERTSEVLPDNESYLEILKERTGIELDAAYSDLPPLPVKN